MAALNLACELRIVQSQEDIFNNIQEIIATWKAKI